MELGWIGIDLDGTLAESHTGEQIGKPIVSMVNKIQQWIAEGQDVRIVTARAVTLSGIATVQRWLITQGLPLLTVTNMKDRHMLKLLDDRAIRIEKNTGIVCSGCWNSLYGTKG